ncbi:hypothetical protein HX017_17215 [Myroides marinus]|uniref:Uncharacterized protein n=2 Tax=Myroides marinus TaxID=703342 RepID=A0A1H6U0G2_9FLAO|nr:DUF6175 family protein [Myroides marinus]KUF38199.1 hypothetical protein AS361_08095 [Myroides marinus]MDM1348681.1 hypothetical protein [Myroides marinus]MDM1351997.1 hypothetical protein [Myroides marinus]MDM1355849.1 hypothetical protein [Myroides marinus]MDM1359175.1 hypothetical protein [Myroides marinus]
MRIFQTHYITQLVVLLMIFIISSSTLAQAPSIAGTRSDESVRAAAKIMVIPYNKQNEDIRTVLDENPYIRTAVSKVKEAFDQRGWSTVDFVANLRAAQANAAFTVDRQSNFKSDLLTTSGADFYVQVDVQLTTDETGTNTVLNLTAFETHTGASFSNKTGTSKFVSNDYEKLISKAFDRIQEEFLNTLMVKTDEIREIGRATIVEFNLDENATIDFDSALDSGEYLNELIEDWISTNAYKGRANLTGILDNKMLFDEVRIPLYDQETNKPYNLNRFATEVIRYLRSKGVQASRNIHGQKMYVTIKQ